MNAWKKINLTEGCQKFILKFDRERNRNQQQTKLNENMHKILKFNLLSLIFCFTHALKLCLAHFISKLNIKYEAFYLPDGGTVHHFIVEGLYGCE